MTAFHSDESLSKEGICAYVRYLPHAGVHGIAPMGSAGEFIALTERERMQAMEWILEEVNERCFRIRETLIGSRCAARQRR